MNRALIAVLLFAALFAVACGQSAPPPPAEGVRKAPPQQPVTPRETPSPTGKQPTGPSHLEDFRRESDAAFAAKREYDAVRKGTSNREELRETYVNWAVHLFAALTFANKHSANGHSLETLPKYRELRELRSGQFKNALGPSDDPRIKEAMKQWQESTHDEN